MEELKNKTKFLSGFGNENMVEEFYLSKNTKLRPGVVLSENDEYYKIELGVPFLKKQDMRVELHKNILVVTGKRINQHAKTSEKSYKGIFHISDDVMKDKIESEFNDGLLTIKFPKNKIKKIHQTNVPGDRV